MLSVRNATLLRLFALILSFGLNFVSQTAWSIQILRCDVVTSRNEAVKVAALHDFVRLNTDKKENWVEVVIPHESGALELRTLPHVADALEILSHVTPSLRYQIEQSFVQAQENFKYVVELMKPIAIREKVFMKARLKDPDSLREKIFERTSSFQRNGRLFVFNALHDLIGVRFIVKSNSEFGKQGQSFIQWAERLGIDPDSVVLVDDKGDAEDAQKGRFYRATHLGILTPNGGIFELQVMTKLVSHWHGWDHKKLYKREFKSEKYKEQMKIYSQFWIQLIRAMEDAPKGTQDYRAAIRDFLSHFPVHVDIKKADWIMRADSQIGASLNIEIEDRFLMESQNGLYRAHKKVFYDLMKYQYEKESGTLH